jgi:transposase-like protein
MAQKKKSKTDVMSRQRGKEVRNCPKCEDGTLDIYMAVKGVSSRKRIMYECQKCKNTFNLAQLG